MNVAPAVPVETAFRRHLTIVFSDLCDSTGIAAAMEPELYGDLLQRLRDAVEAVVARHGGEIVRIDGDGCLFVFGYPHAHEDDGRRATEAALDLHAAAAAIESDYDRSIRLHSGVHSGVVLVRPGDVVRGRFEVLGDPTNVAARLCEAALPDEIVVSEATLGADLAFFRAGDRRSIALKGRRKALPVFSITGREKRATRYAARALRGLTPFVGRDRELQRLDELLDACRSGNPVVAAIVGSPGIGKTRIASEFLDRAGRGGASVHRGYCEAYLGARPLQPIAQLARSLAKRAHLLVELLSSDADGAAPVTPDVVAPDFVALAAVAARRGPVILHIDDWQWIDDASRQILEIAVAGATFPLLLLISTRAIEPTHDHFAGIVRIDLPPLDRAEAVEAVGALLPAADPFVVERIVGRSGGSPLFLEELCHSSAAGHDGAATDRDSWIDTLIQARFANLPPDQAALVRVAAVVGHMIPIWLFEALTGRDASADADVMRDLAANDFIFAGDVPGTLRFKHGLTREAVYRTVGLTERRTLHAQVVKALHRHATRTGEAEPLDALAYHYGASGNVTMAAHYAGLAGDSALASLALDRAQAQYRAALEAAAQLASGAARNDMRAGLIHKYALSSINDPSPEQLPVLEAAAQAAQDDGDDAGLALARYWIGTILYGLGDPRRSIVQLDQAFALAEAVGNARLATQIRANLGQSHLAACHYATAAGLFDRAIDEMRGWDRPGTATGLAYTLGCRALMRADHGDFAAAHRDFEAVEQLMGDAELAMLGSNLTKQCAVRLWQGEYREALAIAGRSLAHGERTRSRFYTMMSRVLIAYAIWNIERDPAAIGVLERSVDWFLGGASQHRTSLCYGWASEVLAEAGRADTARLYAGHALRSARKGDRLGEAMAARAMVRTYVGEGDFVRAEKYLRRAYRSAEARQSRHECAKTKACEAEIALARGEPGRAAAAAAEARDVFRALGMATAADRAASLRAEAEAAASNQ